MCNSKQLWLEHLEEWYYYEKELVTGNLLGFLCQFQHILQSNFFFIPYDQ